MDTLLRARTDDSTLENFLWFAFFVMPLLPAIVRRASCLRQTPSCWCSQSCSNKKKQAHTIPEDHFCNSTTVGQSLLCQHRSSNAVFFGSLVGSSPPVADSAFPCSAIPRQTPYLQFWFPCFDLIHISFCTAIALWALPLCKVTEMNLPAGKLHEGVAVAEGLLALGFTHVLKWCITIRVLTFASVL
jgi:hypothetical protein